jgi:hypothetical protein
VHGSCELAVYWPAWHAVHAMPPVLARASVAEPAAQLAQGVDGIAL